MTSTPADSELAHDGAPPPDANDRMKSWTGPTHSLTAIGPCGLSKHSKTAHPVLSADAAVTKTTDETAAIEQPSNLRICVSPEPEHQLERTPLESRYMPQTPKSTPAIAAEDMMFFSKIVVSTIADSKSGDNITQDDSDLLGVMTRIFILNLDGITPTSEVVMKACGIPPSKLKRVYDELSKKNLLQRLDAPPLKHKGRMFVYEFTPDLLERIANLKAAATKKKP